MVTLWIIVLQNILSFSFSQVLQTESHAFVYWGDLSHVEPFCFLLPSAFPIIIVCEGFFGVSCLIKSFSKNTS